MYEKILQKLKDQRGNTTIVSDRSLEDLAKSLTSVITTEDQLTAADFTNAIKSIEGNINHSASEAAKVAAQKKADELEAARKKKEADDKSKKDEKGNDEEPEWAKTLRLQNEQLRAQFEASERGKAVETRKAQLNNLLQGMPDYLKTPIITGFENQNFENDEKFAEYLNTVKASTDNFVQQAKESGMNFTLPGKDVKTPEATGETDILKEAREVVAKATEKAAAATK